MTGQLKIMWDLDGTLADYDQQKTDYQLKYPYIPFVQCMPGFFSTMPTISKAILCFNAVGRLDGVENYILTAPSNKNPLSYTEKRIWVENLLGEAAVENLILASNKSLILGDVLIDDMKNHGQTEFVGEFIHINNQTDWSGVYNRILEIRGS